MNISNKMVKTLPILWLMAASLVIGIGAMTALNEKPALNQPKTSIVEDLACTLPDGRVGECVPYYNCNVTDKSREVSFGETNCTSYTDVCCTSEDEKYKDPQRTGCGWANPYGVALGQIEISGKLKFGEFPWVVVLLNLEPINTDELESPKLEVYAGAGFLIHPNVALTAASNVASRDTLKVRAGEWNSQNTEEIYPYQQRDVASLEIHKDFDKYKSLYDIAILFVTQPFDLAPNVGVACLPPPNVFPKEGARCYGTGWGKEIIDGKRRYADIPKKIEMPVMKRDKCQETLGNILFDIEIPLQSMCAGGESGKSTCWYHGLSTLSCPIESQKDRYVQSGIVTWDVDCGSESRPGLFFDVSIVRDWIDDKVKEKDYDPKTYTY